MEITVTFTHPRSSKTFVADVGLGLTSQQVILALLLPKNGPFLAPIQPGWEYQIIDSSGVAIPPQTTLGNAGVKDGDTLSIELNVKAG